MIAKSIQPRPSLAAIPMTDLLHRARAASETWRSATLKARGRQLLTIRKALVRSLDDIVRTAQEETAKATFDLVCELFHSASLANLLRQRLKKWIGPDRVWPGLLVNKSAEIRHEPLGVVAIVTPCNYPIVLLLAPVLQAIAAGNAVIVKPSEHATATTRLLVEILSKAGLPIDLLQIHPGGAKEACELASSGVDKVFFTGGVVGGRAVYRAAAGAMTPVVLELGGNDPMIVLADADVERAAHAAVWGAFFNAGQSCIAVERCYVQRPIAEAFTKRVVELTRDLRTVGCDSLGDYEIGPLRGEAHTNRIAELVADAVRLGARVLIGGPAENAQDFPPTVLADVDSNMRIMREETFGPVLPIQVFLDVDEAIRLTNASDLGLSGSVWTRDRRLQQRLIDALQVGGVVVNDALVHFAIPSLPFGGVKGSGFGRTQGRDGLREFVRTKSVVRHRFGPRLEWQWFPVVGKHRWLARACRWLYG